MTDDLSVRKTTVDDIAALMVIYDNARRFMQHTGNANQWIAGYPSESVLRSDIANQCSYVCEDWQGNIVGTFCFFVGCESSYIVIYDGKWLNNDSYGVVHRLAGAGSMKGIADFCLQWCYNQCGNIRVDTHKDNKVMQHILIKNGYVQCGTIVIGDGTSRIAFQKVRT